LGSWFQRLFDKQQTQTLSGIVLSRRYECGWVVTFRTDCGAELSLNVSEDQYRDLREGLSVQLTKKANVLISFNPKE
jgi:hypothetical protein